MSSRFRHIGVWLILMMTMFGVHPAHAGDEPRGVVVDVGANFPFFFTYVEQEVVREFRSDASHPPGYYPLLRERTHPLISLAHVSLALILEELVIRYTFNSLGWNEAVITHTSDDQVEIIDNQFTDVTATYTEYNADSGVAERRSIADLDLPALHIHTLDVGYRYYFHTSTDLAIWGGGEGGLALATFEGPGEIFFGAHVSPMIGLGYDFSSLVSVEVEARYNVIITEAPDSLQNRLNHAVVDDDCICSALIETFQWATFQVGLRINFSNN